MNYKLKQQNHTEPNRRNFIKKSVLGAGLFFSGLPSYTSEEDNTSYPKIGDKHTQRFNMCGFAAPKLEKVRIGFIGLGHRGTDAIKRFIRIEGIEIVALCDEIPSKVEENQKILENGGLSRAKSIAGSKDAWKAVCEDEGIDLVYVCTPWKLHTPMAVYAMKNGKHVATEVPAATTVEECWQLVETSERTKKHCMMLENCCYDFFELLTLSMARQGYFGEIIHGEGAYLHDLLESNFNKNNGYEDMWRLRENFRNGNLYPTHGLGPVCQIMDINRGDKMDYLSSVQSSDFQMGDMADRLAAQDNFYNEFSGKKYRGNMNITVIRTYKGRTIMVQHDVTSPRPYSRIHLVSGTEGTAQKWPMPGRIAKGHTWFSEDKMKELEEKYAPEIVKHIGEIAKQVGGHGGMDFIMDWRLIDCLRNGLPLDQDVYDAALWSSIAPLSEWSVSNRSNSIDIPDFTCGAWETNIPVSLSLEGGGTTGVR